MQRILLGSLSLILLLVGLSGIFLAADPEGDQTFAYSVCLRLGLVLGAIWLALPEIRSISIKTSPAILLTLGGLTVVALVSRQLYLLIPVLLFLGGLKFVHWLKTPFRPKQAPSADNPPEHQSRRG